MDGGRIEQFGRCDIFVNNAATLPTSTLETVTLDLWRRVQATNVEPLLLFAPGVRPRYGQGRMGTPRKHRFRNHAGPPDQGHRLHHLQGQRAHAHALANELAERGVTVNAIAHTVIATPGLLERTPDGGQTASHT